MLDKDKSLQNMLVKIHALSVDHSNFTDETVPGIPYNRSYVPKTDESRSKKEAKMEEEEGGELRPRARERRRRRRRRGSEGGGRRPPQGRPDATPACSIYIYIRLS